MRVVGRSRRGTLLANLSVHGPEKEPNVFYDHQLPNWIYQRTRQAFITSEALRLWSHGPQKYIFAIFVAGMDPILGRNGREGHHGPISAQHAVMGDTGCRCCRTFSAVSPIAKYCSITSLLRERGSCFSLASMVQRGHSFLWNYSSIYFVQLTS